MNCPLFVPDYMASQRYPARVRCSLSSPSVGLKRLSLRPLPSLKRPKNVHGRRVDGASTCEAVCLRTGKMVMDTDGLLQVARGIVDKVAMPLAITVGSQGEANAR